MFLKVRYSSLSKRHTHLNLQGNLIYGIYFKLIDVCLLEPKAHEKYNERHDQHDVEKTFKVGDRVWLHLNKERLWGLVKKIKDLRYSPFEVLDKVEDNSYRINLPPYMHIYSIVNVENMKLYERSMLDKESKQVLPSIEDLVPEA